jgi:hypothetical protein
MSPKALWTKCQFRRIRQSTRCQQKEQLMLWLLSAVIGNQAEMILDDRISDGNHRGEERVLRRDDITNA